MFMDFEYLIEEKEQAILYLDPPYYEKGNELYQHSFTEPDHERLAKLLKETNHDWILSYDNHPKILELYNFANIEEINLNYTINTKNGSRNKTELLITK